VNCPAAPRQELELGVIALIGPDGAGKTTITRRLVDLDTLPLRYLYMGINMEASNRILPTSRLIRHVRRHAVGTYRQSIFRAAARLCNRVAEEWYRQLVCWWWQLRGYTVICDRHFVLDFAPEIAPKSGESLDRRVHRWLLRYCYPKPDLVLFLEAPGEVLYARKGELTVEELDRRNAAFLQVGRRMPNFVHIDATRPLDEVFGEVRNCVDDFCRGGGYTVRSSMLVR
jgi:thymidylate kinase